jgi:hypothetical protein
MKNEALIRSALKDGCRAHCDELIDELRRLSAVEAQRDALLKMLKDVLPVAEDASESLGRFCSDEGWAQEDMDRMDNVDGMLPLIRAAIAAVEGEK